MLERSCLCVTIVAALLVTAVPAAADWTVVPYAGVAFGGQVRNGVRPTFGGSAGWTVNGWLGIEADVAWTGEVFRITGGTEPLFGDSSVTTIMGNAMVGLPWRFGTTRVRPFGVAGLGAIRTRIGDDDAFVSVDNTHLGVTFGGGATIDVGSHFGVRGDVRYLRDLQDLTSDSEFFSLGGTHVSFWRSTAGLSIRF